MPHHSFDLRSRFARDVRGTVAIMFALAIFPVMLTVGLAIDGARGYYTRSKLGAVLDAAALATAKTMRDRDLTDAEVRTIAAAYVTRHMGSDAGRRIVTDDVVVAIDRERNQIRLDVTAHVTNYFGPLVNVPSFEVAQSATAVFGVKEIELGMMLDVSGSMADFGKIDDLKGAVRTLLDIMMPADGGAAKVKVGIAPYSWAVNAGAFAGTVKGNAGDPANLCVSERRGGAAFTDAPPTGGNTLGNRTDRCPASTILPITSRKADLNTHVDGLEPRGATAGHLGAAWAWYLISPDWTGIWPAESQPKAYSDTRVIKSVILMTDGMFNTEYELDNNGASAAQAAAVCANIKARGIIVYTIGFQAPGEVLPLLRGCATTPDYFFDVQNSAALNAAFARIAADLTELRLSR